MCELYIVTMMLTLPDSKIFYEDMVVWTVLKWG